jgi:hypothetical protein
MDTKRRGKPARRSCGSAGSMSAGLVMLTSSLCLAHRAGAALMGRTAAGLAQPLASGGRRAMRAGRPQAAATATDNVARFITGETGNNVTPYIANLVGRGLHKKADHPLGIIKQKIEAYFATIEGVKFEIADALDPVVSAQQCFNDLLIPDDHPGRLPSDTYYLSRPGGRDASSADDILLRTHTSAHQSTLMKAGYEAFLCTGDVYRRDEIDASHFPAFHQMEGVRLFDPALVGEGTVPREEWCVPALRVGLVSMHDEKRRRLA